VEPCDSNSAEEYAQLAGMYGGGIDREDSVEVVIGRRNARGCVDGFFIDSY